MKRQFILIGILILTVIGLGACGSKEPANMGQLFKSGQAKGFNILLVTLDTVRQDRLGCYGYVKASTPTIDHLAAEGVQYYDAVASVPQTLLSHATIMTGQSPINHRTRDGRVYFTGDKPSTLAEDLRDSGYSTAAFVSSKMLDKKSGLERGFDFYTLQTSASGNNPQKAIFSERPANEVTDATVQWLQNHQASQPGKAFFAWVHYYDAHLPYQSPLQTLTAFNGRGYDAEIAYVDDQLKRLINWLDESGTRDNTLIVLTSDHGESLGEHKEATHSMFLYNSTMKVPLIINCPSRIFGHLAVKNSIAGLVDLRDTIGDMVGIPSSSSTDGQSLLQPVAANRSIYMRTGKPLKMAGYSPLHGLQSHGEKFILATNSEYFDLLDDPNELNNLYDLEPEKVAPLLSSLHDIIASADTTGITDRHISHGEAD